MKLPIPSLLRLQPGSVPWRGLCCAVVLLGLGLWQTYAWAKRTERRSKAKSAQAWSPNVAERIVQPGETLWQLCGEVTGKPWAWPRLWALNPQLTNPHWIQPGERIVFVPDQGGIQANYSALPASKKNQSVQQVTGGQGGGGGEPGGDLPIHRGVQVVHTMLLTSKELAAAGRIETSLAEHALLRQGDQILLAFEQPLPEVGQELILIQQGSSVRHPKQGGHVGHISYITGIAKIEQVQEGKIKAIITKSLLEIERGQRAMVLQSPWREEITPLPPSQELVEGFVVGTEENRALVGQRHCIFIDKGSKDGLVVGHPLLVRSERQRQGSGFDALVASLLVVDVRERTATCLVMQMSQEIVVGDKVMSPPALEASNK